jgi:hypothetical protein
MHFMQAEGSSMKAILIALRDNNRAESNEPQIPASVKRSAR